MTGGHVGWMAAVSCAALYALPIAASVTPATTTASPAPVAAAADFRGQRSSSDARLVADWAVRSGDHRGLPFMILDKVNATLHAFAPSGKLVRSTPVLLGMGIGDVFPPGVAEMDMLKTRPWQRVTPAGRFEAEIGSSGRGASLLWIDYDTGIALHKIPARRTQQRRHERIRSPSAADKRVTYGCINVPSTFYDEVVQPAYRARGGIVYVLPETAPAVTVFGAQALAGRAPAALTAAAKGSATGRVPAAPRVVSAGP